MIRLTAILPFSAVSLSPPDRLRNSDRIARFIRLSSTIRNRFPANVVTSNIGASDLSLLPDRLLPDPAIRLVGWCLNSREILNSVPFPGALFTSIDPPPISTRRLIIESPRPLPGTPLVVDFSSRSNGSYICFWNSGLMPMPLSLTMTS